jgi:hypothetical protein
MARKKTARKKATANKSTPKKVENLLQTDGMSEKLNEPKPTTLSQVWGDNGSSKYKTLDEAEYKEKLKGMSKSDLQAEAHRVGLIPIDNVGQLKSRLVKTFKAHVVSFNERPSGHSLRTKGSGLESSVRDILSDGR